ncbi:lysine-specific demethylase 5B-like [Amphiprion ocellaris]|uniref:lysine-specific demethylase 5B-like n=1 Tax=Amphiprion ocellaris TaxID=80972 RepID=UPI000C2FF995|nr:lysine-specific demethylase 5B-like [Amphiprion ocellaris]
MSIITGHLWSSTHKKKKSLYLDSLGESKEAIKKCLNTTRAFMRKKGCNFSRWTCGTVQHTQQSDSTSCGVFALKFAECLLQKEDTSFPATKEAINRHRLEIAVTLLLETDDLTDRCHFCGEQEHESDVNWIQCDVCLRWFHQMCVQGPPAEEDFVCLAC